MLIPVPGKLPLTKPANKEEGEPSFTMPLGAIVIQSDQPYAFYPGHLEKMHTVATLIGQVLDSAQEASVSATTK
jgi:hypothetical protein